MPQATAIRRSGSQPVQPVQPAQLGQPRAGALTTPRGAALYIGALLGPGLLLLPGLAAAQAGPASIVAWLALLVLSGLFAAVFSGLGQRFPQAGGIMGYVAAGLGPRAGRVAGWCFLAGVVGGAPIVCLIGASYVTTLTGGGLASRTAVAALLLLIVLGLSAAGLRASAGAQLVLVTLLIVVVAVAVIGSGRSAELQNWSPFTPHGWPSVGHAATTLMLSFVGWEAVAPLTTRFASPSRQLPRVIAIALAVTTVLYLGLAIATVSVLGAGAAGTVPLADLLTVAVGPAGGVAAAAAAVVLTVGAVNAYVNGAIVMARQLTTSGPGRARPPHTGRSPAFLLAVAAAGLVLITLDGLRLVSTASLVILPTTLFLVVYLGSMAAATRVLCGTARAAARVASLAVLAMLPYCGWALLAPAAVGLIVTWPLRRRRQRTTPWPVPAASRPGRDEPCRPHPRRAPGMGGTEMADRPAAASVPGLATAASRLNCAASARKGPATEPRRVAAASQVRNAAHTRPSTASGTTRCTAVSGIISDIEPNRPIATAAGKAAASPRAVKRAK
jgi:amino acid efflux transporter